MEREQLDRLLAVYATGGFVGHGRQLAGVEGVASGGGEGWIYR